MGMDSELKYWVGVSGFVGMGYKRFRLLREYFGSVRRIWQAGVEELVKLGVKQELAYEWQRWRQGEDLDAEMERLAKGLIKVVTIDDERYPKLLKEIDLPPILLYIKGRVEVLGWPSLTVVGTRKMTEYGRKVGRRLVKGLVGKNLVIVSGLARGIDTVSHQACLEAGGKTVAVLGHGLDRIYPQENLRLAKMIVDKGGCLVTEYPLGYPISRGNFPARDRIMAGLSLGTLVVEGAKKSGTKITAGFAGDYGREVFCVPGPVDSPQSAGAAELIQQGAKLVTKVEDVMEELRLPEG